jgi:hypothetical protein
MSLYLVEPKDANADACRKLYVDGLKTKSSFATWNVIHGEEVEVTPANFIEALHYVWDNDLSVYFSQFAPRDLSGLQERVCEKGKPLIHKNRKWWRRKGEVLEDSFMEFVVLDFDGDHPDISTHSCVSKRLEVAKSLLPPLRGLEAVALYSSSAFFKDCKRPNRISLHVIVWLDKPYPRSTVHAFLKTYKTIVDAALGVKTQPHFVANPIFKNTPKVEVNGERVIHVEGGLLSLENIDLSSQQHSFPNTYSKGKKLSNDSKEKAAQILKMALAGELDGQRNHFLYTQIWRENFYNDGETDAFLEAIDRPEITNGSDGRHDVYEMDSNAKNHIWKKLSGAEFGGAKSHQKIISHLELADYDLTDIPLEKSVITVKSGCGSGKTKGFIKRIVELTGYKRCLYVSQLKATIQPAAQDIGFAYYLEKGEDAKKDFCLSHDRLAITDKSLNTLITNDGFKPYDLVILDESERIAMNSIDVHSRQHELFEICKAAKLVLLLDADASPELSLWFAKEIADKSTPQKELLQILNTKDWMGEGHHAYQLINEEDTIGIVEKLLEKGERVYFHVGFSDKTEERRISALVCLFQDTFPDKNIKGFDALNAPKELRKNPNEYIDWLIEEEGLDLLIHSPWSKIGWDYNGKHHFDATVGSYPHTFMTAPDIAQQMRRPRQTKKHYFWIGRKPKNAEQRLRDLEKTYETDSTFQRMKKDIPFELKEKATRHQTKLEANISFHLNHLLKERGCIVHRGYSTDVDIGRVEPLLTKYGEDSEAEAILKAWSDVLERDYVLSDFYAWRGHGKGKQWANHPDLRQDLSLEDFASLRRRDLNIEDKDIGSIARIWFSSPERRGELDEEDSRYFALITGEMLDAVDQIVNKHIGKPQKFVEWVMDERSPELYVSFNNEDFQPIKDLFSQRPERYSDFVPWIREKRDVKDFAGFFERMADLFDIGFECLKASGGKVEVKDSIIRHYMKLYPKIVKPSKAEKISKKGEKIEAIEAHIDEQLAIGERLDQKQEMWMCHRFDRRLHFFKHELRNEVVNSALEKSRR